MCGIAGCVSLTDVACNISSEVLRMTRSLAHRGPDDEGLVFYHRDGRVIQAATDHSNTFSRSSLPDANKFLHADWSLVLGHRRFSILEPSADGHQPFLDRKNRVGLVFNGEIYNYIELRQELENSGVVFYTRTDTEVLLQAYLQWGESMLPRLNGMWAFALADFRSGQLLLSRDRLGEKPLFFSHCANRLYFASEIKALFQVSEIYRKRKPNNWRVWDYLYAGLRDHYPGSFYEGIDQLPPGVIARVAANGRLVTKSYWQLPRERLSTRDISYLEAATEVSRRLKDSVALRLRSDMPLASELSGGMDSTSIVSFASDLLRDSGRPLQTVTTRYEDSKYDESPLAMEVANLCRVPWKSILLDDDDYWNAAEEMVLVQEQPYESPNQIGSRAMWRWLKACGIRVVLTGGGGDELFAGYIRHMLGPLLMEFLMKGDWQSCWRETRSWRGSQYLNKSIIWASLLRHLPRLFGRWYFSNHFASPLYAALRQPKQSEYRGVIANHQERMRHTLSASLLSSMEYSPMPMYMVHGDKLSMSIPIEVRFPFLDPALIDYVFQLPVEYLIRNGESKSVLRESMRKRLPETIINRRDKMGFPVPLQRWMSEGRSRIVAEIKNGGHAKRFLNIDYISSNCGKIDPELLWRIHQVETWMRLHDLT